MTATYELGPIRPLSDCPREPGVPYVLRRKDGPPCVAEWSPDTHMEPCWSLWMGGENYGLGVDDGMFQGWLPITQPDTTPLRVLRAALERAINDLDAIGNQADPFDDAVGTQDHALLLDIERAAVEASNRANHALRTIKPGSGAIGATADAFYDLANQLRSCIDPATPEREAADFRRIADRAAALGDNHRLPLATTTLADCPIGLFVSSYGTLCVKTEYGSNEGRIDAYIVKSGEMFWGAAPQTIASQRAELVTPVAVDIVVSEARAAAAPPWAGVDYYRRPSWATASPPTSTWGASRPTPDPAASEVDTPGYCCRPPARSSDPCPGTAAAAWGSCCCQDVSRPSLQA